jgi:RNA polymerase-interacting CarD/CdnL/TRCF family regulator
MSEAKKYISDSELSLLFKIPKDKIIEEIKKYYYIKIGNRFYVPISEIEQYGVNTVSNQEKIKESSINKKPSKP